MNKTKTLAITLSLFITQFVLSAQFYWVGGSGNWSDVNHWATTSGGSTLHSVIPGIADTVIVDNASFSSNDTLVFDVGIAQIARLEMNNVNNPTFLGNATDGLTISGGLSIANSINDQFRGAYIFNGVGTHTIDLPTVINSSLVFNTSGSYTVSPFTSSQPIEVVQGDIVFNDFTAFSFITTGLLTKNVSFSDISLSGDGLILDLNTPNTNLLSGPSNLVSSYLGSNGVQISVNTLTTNNLEIAGEKVQLEGNFDVSLFDVANTNLIELVQGTVLKASTFAFTGTCSSYKSLIGLGSGASLDNDGNAFSFDYIQIQNIEEIGGVNDSATNSVDLGGVINIDISSGAQNFYWVGGQGNWSDLSSWSTTSPTLTATTCLPGPNDTVIVDVNSSFAAGDSLFLDMDATVARLDLSQLSTNITLDGGINQLTLRHSLDASPSLSFNWKGGLIFDQIDSVASIKTNGSVWGTSIVKRDTNALLLLDQFEINQHFILEEGSFFSQGNDLIFDDLLVLSALNTQIDFSSSSIEIKGDTVSFNSPNLTSLFTGSTISLDNTTTNEIYFFGGGQNFDTVIFLNPVNQIFNNAQFVKLELFPGNTNIFEVNSTYAYSNLALNSDCANKTALSASSAIGNSPLFSYTGVGLISSIEYLELDNIDADTTGGRVYNLSFADTINNCDNWTLMAGAYYWVNNTGNWTDPSHWSASSGGAPIGCIPSKRDTVIFDANSFTLPNQTVTINIEDSVRAMNWEQATNNPTLQLDSNFHILGDLVLNANMKIEAASLFNYLGIEPHGNNARIKTNNCIINTQLLLLGKTLADTISLEDNFTTVQDSIGLTIGGGTFLTNGNDINVNVISITFPVAKKIVLDSSNINLSFGWVDTSAVNNLVFDAGTSTITIDSSLISQGYLLSRDGLDFNNVNLYYTSDTSYISGDNSYNNLTIYSGSRVALQAGATQTVNGTFRADALCTDSISLFSDIPGVQTRLIVSDSIQASVLNVRDVFVSGGPSRTYFSTDLGNNTGWIFDTTAVANLSLSLSNDYCLGDTTQINSSYFSVFGSPSDFLTTFDFGIITADTIFGAADTTYQVVFSEAPDTTVFTAQINSFDSLITVSDTSYQILFQTFPDTTNLGFSIVSFDSIFGYVDTNFQSITQIFPDTNSYVFEIADTNRVTMIVEYLPKGCKVRKREDILIRDPAALLSASSASQVCSGTDVTLTTTVFPFDLSYNVFRNNLSIGSTANDSIIITDMVDGDFFYAIVNDAGCLGYSDTLNFNVVQSPTVNINAPDTICDGVPLVLSGETADRYRFFKGNVGLTSFIFDSTFTVPSVMDQDTFYVVGLDSSGCSDTSQLLIMHVNPSPTISLSSSDTDNIICAGDQVSFTATGALTYDYRVNGTSQSGFIPGSWNTSSLLSGQTVSAVGRDANGCESTAPQTFTHLVNAIPNPTITTSDSDLIICEGEQVQFSAGGAAQYQFFVNGTSLTGLSGTSFTSTSALADNDEIYVVGISNNCEGFSDTITYQVIDLPNLVFTSSDADNIICQGDAIDFTATGGSSYTFTVNGGNPVSNSTGLYSNAMLTNGQEVAVEAEQNGCSTDSLIAITVNPRPSVNFFTTEADLTICEGESITFNATNATTFEFFVNGVSQGAPSTQNSFVTTSLPVGTPTIFAVGYNSFGCLDTSSAISITVNPLPAVSLLSSDANDTICASESVLFTAAGASQYQYFVNGLSQGLPSSNNQFTTNNLANGDIVSVRGTTNGCALFSPTTYTFTVNPNPIVTLSSDDTDNVFCEGDAVTLTAAGAMNYEFFLNTVSNGTPSTISTLDASTLAADNYVVDVIGEQMGCTGTSQLALTVFGSASVNFVSSDADNTICQGESVQFTGSGASLYEFFVNGNSQGAPTTLATFTTGNLVNGDAVYVQASTAQGCSVNSAPISTTVLPTPVVSLNSSIVSSAICNGDLLSFTASGATTYTFFVNGTAAMPASATAIYDTDSLSTGDIVSVLGSTGQCSASSATTFSYTVFDNPMVSLINPDDNNLCVGEGANLIANGANNYQFSVNGIPQGTLNSTNTFTASVNDGDQISVLGESNNCTSTAAQTITYNVIPFPTTTLSSSDADNIICLDEAVTFTANGASTYSFFIDGIEQTNTTPNTLTTSELENGNLVAVVGFNGDCQTTAPNTFTFTVNEMNLGVTANPSNYMICEGESFELTANGGDNYEFFVNGVSQGPLSVSPTFVSTNLSAGDFIEFIASNNTTGCIQTYANTIYPTVTSTPILTAAGSTTFCENDSVMLLTNALGTIEWYVDGTVIANAVDTTYIAESSGIYHYDLTTGGNNDVYAVGYNANGELGIGDNFNTATPTQANTITNALAIDAGDEFSGAITASGELYMWGQNNTGQLGNGTYTSTNNPILITGIPTLNGLSLGSEHTAVVTATGAVFTWGQNDFGQLGIGNTLTVNTPQLVTAVSDIVEVASGKSHTLFLRNDGTVWSVGNNDFGQLGNGTLVSSSVPSQITGLSDVARIKVGEYHSIAITTTGNVYVWGNNTVGQLGLGDLTNRLSPTLSSLKDIVDADGGATHTLLVNDDGDVFATGGNVYGQLGTGDQLDRNVPVQVVGLNGVQAVSAGQYHSLSLKQDFSVWGYGRNENEQLGALPTTSITNAAQLTEALGVTAIAAGKEFTQFIYGLSNTCSSNTLVVDELPAPVPVISINNGSLFSSEIADSYQWFVNGIDIVNSNNISQTPSQNGNYVVETTYSNGCTQSSLPFAFNTVGLDEVQVVVNVYPNPVNDKLHVELSYGQFNEVSVLDLAGRLVYTTNQNTQKVEIDTFNWEKGVYIVRIHTTNGQIEKRVVKQ